MVIGMKMFDAGSDDLSVDLVYGVRGCAGKWQVTLCRSSDGVASDG